MKQVSRDTKYIIKRILIGVGIAIILFNFKKCNVYALTKINLQGSSASIITNTTNYKKVGEYKDTLLDLEFYMSNNLNWNYYYPIIFKYRDESNDIKFLIDGIASVEDLSQEDITIGSLGLEKDFNITSRYSVQFPSNLYLYNDNGIICNGASGVSSSCTSANNKPFNAMTYSYSNINNSFIYYNSTQNTISEGITATMFGQYIYNNTTVDFYNSNVPFDLTIGKKDINYDPPVQDPLANLTQVDITGYEGALIVPKDYEYMNEHYTTTQESAPGVFTSMLNLSFYTQNCTRQTLINLTNVKNLYTNNIGVSTGSLSASISGTCPTEPTETIMSYQYDMYSGMIPMGILLYNNEINEDGSFGTSYFWYDSTLYDIYMIDNLDNFSAEISFIDFDGTEKELTIDGLPSFQDMAEYALANETELGKGKVNSLFSFIQAPFSFLNLIKSTKCTALRFPFPNSNQIIIIPCMSETYTRIGGDLIYTISIIINGLIVYRCIITMIHVTEAMMDADDDKLEVLEL